MATKSERFTSLGKIQQQRYGCALQHEREAEKLVDELQQSIAKIREYQRDYQNSLSDLRKTPASSDQLRRMTGFIRQLMQAEVAQMQRLMDAQKQLSVLQEQTIQQLKKVYINNKLVEQADTEQLLLMKKRDNKKMDAVANSLFARRISNN